MTPLTLEPLRYHLLDRPVKPTVRFFTKPRLRQLIHVLETIKRTMPGEEVALDVTHHPLHLALGSGTIGTASMRSETVTTRQVNEPLIEHNTLTVTMTNHRRLLVVDQNLLRDIAKVFKSSHWLDTCESL